MPRAVAQGASTLNKCSYCSEQPLKLLLLLIVVGKVDGRAVVQSSGLQMAVTVGCAAATVALVVAVAVEAAAAVDVVVIGGGNG